MLNLELFYHDLASTTSSGTKPYDFYKTSLQVAAPTHNLLSYKIDYCYLLGSDEAFFVPPDLLLLVSGAVADIVPPEKRLQPLINVRLVSHCTFIWGHEYHSYLS